MNFSISLSKTSALVVDPFQEKLKILSRSSTLSANHSCKPAGVLRNSYKMEGEHLTGYSNINCCFLLISILYIDHFFHGQCCNNRKIIQPPKFFYKPPVLSVDGTPQLGFRKGLTTSS